MRPEICERSSSSEMSDSFLRTSAPSITCIDVDSKSERKSVQNKRRNSIAALQNTIQNKFSSLTLRRRSSGLEEVSRGRRMSLSYTSTLTSCLRHSIDKDEFCDITLNLALRNSKLLDMFRKFLQVEMSEENLDFYLAVEKLQNSKNRKLSKTRAECDRIYREHLVPGSEFEINVGPEVRRQIETDLQNENYDCCQLYKEAQAEVYLLIKQDSFPRFKKYLKDNDLG